MSSQTYDRLIICILKTIKRKHDKVLSFEVKTNVIDKVWDATHVAVLNSSVIVDIVSDRVVYRVEQTPNTKPNN